MKALFARLFAALDAYQQRHLWLSFPLAVVRKTTGDQGGSLAALVAYYGFLSVFPLLLVFAAVLGFVLSGDQGLQQSVLHHTERSFPALSGFIDKTIKGSSLALGIGLVVALWAGLGVTRATERAMNAVWDIPLAERPNLWWSRLRGLGLLVVLGATFLVSTALASVRGVGIGAVPLAAVAIVGPLLLNFVLYLVAFQVLTNRHLSWRTMVPGAAVGAVGWTVLQSLGAYYTRHEVAHASQLYGTLGFVVGLLAWIYLGAQLTIYAAEINVVLAHRLWPRRLTKKMPRTDADRRALVLQAKEARRTEDQVISVTFKDAGDQAGSVSPAPKGTEHRSERPPGPSGEPGGLLRPEVPGAPTTVGVSALVVHLQAFDHWRRQLDSGVEGRPRRELLDRLCAEARHTAASLEGLSEHEAELAVALARHER